MNAQSITANGCVIKAIPTKCKIGERLGGLVDVHLTIRVPADHVAGIEAMAKTGQAWFNDFKDYVNLEVLDALFRLFHVDASLEMYCQDRPELICAGRQHVKAIAIPYNMEDACKAAIIDNEEEKEPKEPAKTVRVSVPTTEHDKAQKYAKRMDMSMEDYAKLAIAELNETLKNNPERLPQEARQ